MTDHQPPADRTRSLMGNTAMLVVGQLSGLLVSIALTPFILGRLGLAEFGLWVFLTSVVAYAGLLQIAGRGTVRFIAYFAGRQELHVARSIVSWAVGSYIVMGAILIPLSWLAASTVVPLLGVSPRFQDLAIELFPVVLAYFFFSAGIRPLASLLTGIERMWLTSLITSLSQLVYGAAVVILLSEGAGIHGLLWAAVIQTAFQGFSFWLAGRRLIGRVFGNPLQLPRATIKEMLRFGGWTQINTLSSLVNRQTDAIFIGAWVSASAVGIYDVGNRLALLVRALPLTLLGPLLPAAAATYAAGDHVRLERMVRQATRLIGVSTIATGALVLATAPLALEVWLGEVYTGATTVTTLLACTYMVNNLTGVGTTMAAAIGRPRLETEYAIMGLVLNVAATLVLGPMFGFHGILAATLFAVVTCSIYFIWRFHSVMALSLRHHVGSWLWRAVGASTGAALLIGVLQRLLRTGERLPDLLTLLALTVVYAILIIPALRMFRFFDMQDADVVHRLLPRRFRSRLTIDRLRVVFGA